MFQRGFFLLVTPNDGLAHSLRAPMQRYAVTRHMRGLEEALELLRTQDRWSAVVMDLAKATDPAHCMLQVREANALVSALAVLPSPSPQVINAAHAHRIELSCQPVGDSNMAGFMRRAMVHGWLPDGRVAAWVDELAQRRSLTAREVQLIAYALGSEPRRQVMRRLGITENTLKTQVRSLLRKCGARSMDGLAHNVLRQALISERQPAVSSCGSGSLPLAAGC